MSFAFAQKIKIVLLAASVVVAVAILTQVTTTMAEVPACTAGKCPKEITIDHNNKILTYKASRKFNVVLNEFDYPPEDIRCVPEGVISQIGSAPDLYPNHMLRFQAEREGTCMLQNNDFAAIIVIIPTSTKPGSVAQK
jgi:hypothetical protein